MSEVALNVAVEIADRLLAERQREVLASLPSTLHIAEESRVDVIALSGAEADWIERAGDAIETGVRGVLLTRACCGEPAAVRALERTAAAASAHVVVESPALDPTWLAARDRLRTALATATMVDAVAVIDPKEPTSLSAALIEQLMLLGMLTSDLRGIRGGLAHGCGWAVATAASAAVTMAGIASSADSPALRLDVIGEDFHWRVRFDRDAVACPTRIARDDAEGSLALPESYEGTSRASWRALARAVDSGAPPDAGLGALATALERAAHMGAGW